MKPVVVALAILFALSCRPDNIITDTTDTDPRPLPAFTVTVIDRAATTAIIEWDEVMNIYANGDTVKYKVKLEGRLIDSNLTRLTDTIRNISPDTLYNGRVYAYTKTGDTASAPFILDALNGYVYFGNWENAMISFNIHTGQRAWKSEVFDHAFIGMPTVENEVLYVNNSRYQTYAFNAKTGVKLWNTNFSGCCPNGGEVNPLYHDGKVYTTANEGIYALNAATGSVLWSYTTTGLYDANPVIAGNRLIAANMGSTSYFVALDATTGAKAWDYTFHAYITRNPVVYKDLLIFGGSDGKIHALYHATGAVAWTKIVGGTCEHVSPVLNGDHVIVHSTSTGIYSLVASSGATHWNYAGVTTPNLSSPAVGLGKVFFVVRHYPDSKAIAFNMTNGQIQWEHTFGPAVDWPSPILVKNRLYFGNNVTYGNEIQVLDANTGQPFLPVAIGIQWGKETIVENDTTYYLPQSGMKN